mmetsp:Transcript_104213/g.301481  ORF Transcript_104213/g.301481 Transcript_104213/m.301481 type:complete len:254 (+) Transcript_104213:1328-2089(+)
MISSAGAEEGVAPSGRSEPSRANFSRARCQNWMMIEVQMGSDFQEALTWRMSCTRSTVSSKPPVADRKTARTAVSQDQLASVFFMSSSTASLTHGHCSLSSRLSSSGDCQTSTASPETSTSSSPTSPMSRILPVDWLQCSRRSASWRPRLWRVASTVLQTQITWQPLDLGHTLAKRCPSSLSLCTILTGCTTSITCPRKPPAVPNSRRPPVPRTKIMSPTLMLSCNCMASHRSVRDTGSDVSRSLSRKFWVLA